MTRVRLKPAELRNGVYVQPVALLEPEQLWAGHREVWTATHGRATCYHVMVDGGVAACRARNASMIVLGALMPVTQVPAMLCCLRNGCLQRFLAAAAAAT